MAITYAHTNIVAKDWRRLAAFYRDVLACSPVPPERHLHGAWLDKATGLDDAYIEGIHLRLPGYGDRGPTLEIFEYRPVAEPTNVTPNTPGLTHVAFAVDDVAATAQTVFEYGGTPIGELTIRDIASVGRLTFQYVTDPEGNMIELQNWQRAD